jgi:regulatory protein
VRITRIEPQQRRPGRFNIQADGEFLIGVSAETLVSFALRTGDEITEETRRRLEDAEDSAAARAAAMRLLAVRPRTEKEIRDRLRAKEFGDERIAALLEDLRRSGLVNDEQFCRMFVHDVLALRPTGRIPLRRKLLLLGVPKETVDRTLDEAFEGVDVQGAALELARAFLRKDPARRDPAKLRPRLASYLGRKGYGWDIIQQVLRKVTGDDEQSGL